MRTKPERREIDVRSDRVGFELRPVVIGYGLARGAVQETARTSAYERRPDPEGAERPGARRSEDLRCMLPWPKEHRGDRFFRQRVFLSSSSCCSFWRARR